MVRTFTREALFELVWQRPVSKLAKELGMSDVGLSKICRRAEIPLPPQGHWARLLAGKTIARPALPPRGLGKPEEIEFGGSRYGRQMPGAEEVVAMEIPAAPVFTEGPAELMVRARATIKRVVVPRRLDRLHPEIAGLLRADEERLAKQQRYSYSWDQPLFTSSIERRRLRILNGLFLALTACGCMCRVSGKEARSAYVRIGEETVSFPLDQVGAKERRYSDRVDPIPEGAKLKLKLDWWEPPSEQQTEWFDTKDTSIESHATDIGIATLIAGEWAYRSWLVRRRNWIVERRREFEEEKRREKLEAEQKERARLARIAKDRRERLLADARAWRDAADIRTFVEAVKIKAPHTDPGWISWALDEADRLDPTHSAALAVPGEN